MVRMSKNSKNTRADRVLYCQYTRSALFWFGVPEKEADICAARTLDRGRGCDKIHYNKMADASAHHKQMKNLVRAKFFVAGVEQREL